VVEGSVFKMIGEKSKMITGDCAPSLYLKITHGKERREKETERQG